MERVTIEHNGERITVEVPDGMSDEDILNFVKSQPSESAAPKPVAEQVVNKAAGGLREGVYDIAKDAGNWVKENPQTAFDLATLGGGAYLGGKALGMAGKAVGGIPGMKALGSKALDLSKSGLASAAQGMSNMATDIGQSARYYGDVAKTGVSDISRSQVKYPNVGKALVNPAEAMKATGKAGSELMSKYGPMAAKLGIPLSVFMTAMTPGELNTNEEEELAKRRKQGATITSK